MAKIRKAYDNKELLDKLTERDSVYADLKYYTANFDDEQLKVLDRLNTLTQFEKDLLYLSSSMGGYEIAELYEVSPSLIYKNLRNIKKKLNAK